MAQGKEAGLILLTEGRMCALLLQCACLAMSVLLASFVVAGREVEGSHRGANTAKNTPVSRVEPGHLTVDSNIRDLLYHPAFREYSRLLMPRSDRTYDENMRLGRHAEDLGVDKRDYALWGSSAGARMAAAIGSHGVAAFGGDHLPKPAAVVMAYTAHSDTSSNEPPTFVVVGEGDGIAPPSVMERRVSTLRRAGTEVEYRKYKDLGHGFGPGTGTSAEGWIADATRFWQKSMKSTTRSKADRP